MEYNKIIQNIISNSELIAECENTLKNIKNNDTQTELIYAARHLALDKIDFTTKENASDNFKELLDELDSIAINDTCENTIISLQLSSILDQFLQKLSKNEQKIYIYRYFYAHSIETIASLCSCSASNVTKSLSSTNSTLKTELQKKKIQCDANTFLRSFADIDILILNSTIDGNSEKKDNGSTSSTKPFIPWQKLLNISFAVLLLVLIITNLYFITDGFGPDKSPSDKDDITKPESEQFEEDDNLIIYVNSTKTVNTDTLLNYVLDTGTTNTFTYTSEYFVGIYNTVELDASGPIESCLGKEITELSDEYKTFYQLKGKNSKDYLIQKNHDNYYLHILSFIINRSDIDDEYIGIKFSHIAENFYGLYNGTEIKSITTLHPDTNSNFDDIRAKKLFDNARDIDTLFDIINRSHCSSDLYSLFYEDTRFSLEYLMQTSVQLIIEKKDGTVIDWLYYKPESHYFFDITSNLVFVPDPDIYAMYSYLDNMLGFNQHKVEPTDPASWTIEADVYEPNLEYLGVSIHQTSAPKNGLYIGQDFILEKYVDGKWKELPVMDGYNPELCPIFAIPLDARASATTTHFYPKDKYNISDSMGKYRITIKIYDSNSENLNNPTYREYSMDFEIDETNSTPNVIVNTWPED